MLGSSLFDMTATYFQKYFHSLTPEGALDHQPHYTDPGFPCQIPAQEGRNFALP